MEKQVLTGEGQIEGEREWGEGQRRGEIVNARGWGKREGETVGERVGARG